jgi:chromatin assembly factor 1 subunit A
MEALKSVPIKSIKFREDVRPPYIGTISGLPTGVKSLQQLARKPISKILPLDYDYDSEAEWQEEEGEDVDDLDDDEEEPELDEDMDDFLDDSEDVGPARIMFSGMEPESIGPSWEDRKRSAAEPKLYKNRLEFILGKPCLSVFSALPFFSLPPLRTLLTIFRTPRPPPQHRPLLDRLLGDAQVEGKRR